MKKVVKVFEVRISLTATHPTWIRLGELYFTRNLFPEYTLSANLSQNPQSLYVGALSRVYAIHHHFTLKGIHLRKSSPLVLILYFLLDILLARFILVSETVYSSTILWIV